MCISGDSLCSADNHQPHETLPRRATTKRSNRATLNKQITRSKQDNHLLAKPLGGCEPPNPKRSRRRTRQPLSLESSLPRRMKDSDDAPKSCTHTTQGANASPALTPTTLYETRHARLYSIWRKKECKKRGMTASRAAIRWGGGGVAREGGGRERGQTGGIASRFEDGRCCASLVASLDNIRVGDPLQTRGDGTRKPRHGVRTWRHGFVEFASAAVGRVYKCPTAWALRW